MLKYEEDSLWNYGSSVPLKAIIQSVVGPTASLTYSNILTSQVQFNQAVGYFDVLVVAIASGNITTPLNRDQIRILNKGNAGLTINDAVTMASGEMTTFAFKNGALQYFY